MRAAWRRLVAGGLDAGRLVFVDEMGANTSLSPLYACSRCGERARGVRCRATLREEHDALGESMGSEGMGPTLAVEGGVNEAVFEA